MDLECEIGKIWKVLAPITRGFDFNDSALRFPNGYENGWKAQASKSHSYYKAWTELDKRSAQYTKAKIEGLALLCSALYANSRLEDYSDHGSYNNGTGASLIYYNYEKMLHLLPKQMELLLEELKTRIKFEIAHNCETVETKELEDFYTETMEFLNDSPRGTREGFQAQSVQIVKK